MFAPAMGLVKKIEHFLCLVKRSYLGCKGGQQLFKSLFLLILEHAGWKDDRLLKRSTTVTEPLDPAGLSAAHSEHRGQDCFVCSLFCRRCLRTHKPVLSLFYPVVFVAVC